MNASPGVCRIMNDQLHLGTADWTVGHTIEHMLHRNLSCLMIVDSRQRLIGLVTESSLLAAALDPMQRGESVSLFMQRKMVTIPDTASWDDAIEMFLLHRVRQIPVLRNGVPVGMLCRRQLLQQLANPHSPMANVAAQPQSSVVDD